MGEQCHFGRTWLWLFDFCVDDIPEERGASLIMTLLESYFTFTYMNRYTYLTSTQPTKRLNKIMKYSLLK